MSSALAIASVTHVLKDLLNNGIINNDVSSTTGGIVNITALPPDRVEALSQSQSRLNLFLYRVTPNTGWINTDLPSRNSRGELTSNPPLALDLHYLLSAYGASEFHAEILLGYGMQILHENPGLDRDSIRRSLAPSSSTTISGLPPELQALSTSDLAEQVEQIKITPEVLNTEEISKLWSAFQAKYRPTVAYHVSVVLIESDRSTKSGLPVRERLFYALPFIKPEIQKISSQIDENHPVVEHQKILSGYNLVINGKDLEGDIVEVNMGGLFIAPDPDYINDKQITIQIPASLSAGMHAIQVVHQNLMGSPPEVHRGVESNVSSFVLSPQIVNIDKDLDNNGGETFAGDVEVEVTPPVGEKQGLVLLMNEIWTEITSPPEDKEFASYSFKAPIQLPLSPPGPFPIITVPVSGVNAGTYLIRIQVDGAESPLLTDSLGKYDQPQITIL